MATFVQALKNPWISVPGAVLTAYTFTLITTFCDKIGCIASVEGKSMQPTLNPMVAGKPRHEWVWINKLGSARYKYERGDVVVLKSPTDPKRYLVKRIIGLPGDWIELKDKRLMEVNEGNCWIEGDNSRNSIDSYHFGQIPLGLVEGKVKYVIFPFTCIRSVSHFDSEQTRLVFTDEELKE